jgi:hypothetical protein
MPQKRRYKVHEVLSMLEDDSEFTEATMFITPPVDQDCSDEDSADDECGTANNFTRRQLEASAEVTIRKGNTRIRFGNSDESDDDSNSCFTEPLDPNDSDNAETLCPTVLAESAVAKAQQQKRTETDDLATTSTVAEPGRRSRRQPLRSSLPSPKSSNSACKKPAKVVLSNKRPRNETAVSVAAGSSSTAKKLKVGKPVRKWVKADLPNECKIADEIPDNQYSNEDLTPSALFERFIDDAIIALLVGNTNKYATQKGRHEFSTTSSELRLFLAVLFTSGYAPLPRRRMYWEPAVDVRNVAISGAMTRNRFEELLCNIHVADNDNLPPGDKMAKVRPLFTELNKRFIMCFPRQKNLAVDESMVPYYGRHSAKQYIRGKPIRFGYKVWSINTPLGYCAQMEPYQGAGVTHAELGLGGSVVVNLVKALPTDNYIVYFDNFFTSLRLLEQLSDLNIHATGTVRANRIENCPVSSVDKFKKTARGSFDYLLDSGSQILVTRYHSDSLHIDCYVT